MHKEYYSLLRNPIRRPPKRACTLVGMGIWVSAFAGALAWVLDLKLSGLEMLRVWGGGGGVGGLSEGVEGGLGRLLPVVERLGLKACLRALGLKEAPALFKDDRGFDAVSRKPRLNGSGCQ